MSLYGAFDVTNHFSELADPLIGTQQGTLSSAVRIARCLENLGLAAIDDTGELTLTAVQSVTATSDDHLLLNTVADNKQIRINSRSYVQTSGGSLGFQSKPSQTVNTSGDITGGEISPRCQSGVTAGQIKGLHVDIDLKGTAAGTIGVARVLELEAVADVSGGRTITGDLTIIKTRMFCPASGGVSGDTTVIAVPAPETGSVPYDAFAKFDAVAGLAANHASSGVALPADVGWVRVKVGATFYKLPLYND